MQKCLEEAVLRVALRNDLTEIVKLLHDYLSETLHMEYVFYFIKQVLSLRAVEQYEFVSNLLIRIYESGDVPSGSQQLDILRIQRSAAFVVLMENIAGINRCSRPLSNSELLTKIKQMLPKRNKSLVPERFDQRTKEYRVALMLTMMKQRRIKRLRHRFNGQLHSISQQIEKFFDKVRAEILPPFDGLPLQNYFFGADVARTLYDEIVQKEGVSEKSLKKFLKSIEDSPYFSFNFFDTPSQTTTPTS